MADQTIKPVLPVTKARNTLQNKKAVRKNSQSADEKLVDEKPEKKKSGVDTYA